jgi:hypothetical protein
MDQYSEQRKRVMRVLGEFHGDVYVDLQGARAALDSALEEIGRLQKTCAKQSAEILRLRDALDEIAERAGNTHIGSMARRHQSLQHHEGTSLPKSPNSEAER